MGVDEVNGRAAVFLDRDGVLNHNWMNPKTGEWESPIRPGDFRLRDGVLDALALLQSGGNALFLISNQPSAAKGKCTLEDLAAVHKKFEGLLNERGIRFLAFYYSYSHPKAVVPGMTEPACERKPSPYFIERAVSEYALEKALCWMVGDRGTDIECGHRAGLRTIQVTAAEPDGKDIGAIPPNFRVDSFREAVDIIRGQTV